MFCKKKCFRPANLLKQRFWYRCFPVNFAKFIRTPFLQNTSGRLLLNIYPISTLLLTTVRKCQTGVFISNFQKGVDVLSVTLPLNLNMFWTFGLFLYGKFSFGRVFSQNMVTVKLFQVYSDNYTKAAVQRCSVRKVFLKFCKIHRQTPLSESLF